MMDEILKSKIVCKILPCSRKHLTYKNFIEKHITFHIEKEIACPLGCDEILTNEKAMKPAINHFKKCQKMTKLCDTCGIVHFPNEIDSKNQMECIHKLKDVLEETLEVLKE